ncbi:NAD(P)H-dependent oxidoreductase [Liquorilactobacillus capillatus]|uniref:Flavoprotein n=1 Tax=Liquorilactobacillus capillatus DSM 19910 TaxID=1423731 RepID=A0A0R1LZ94_9LACO|nr:NAD(P)H-dependent oxidoreductase [Liquorilactobacillus capillatus]KRL00943.1 flavoprotein [Liquorilactobacillus capillatus DSM 19910]
MKLVGIAGSIADESYNRKLLTYVASHFTGALDIEILSISDVPMFSQDNDQTEGAPIQYLKRKIEEADGVIMATPEHNHTTTPALKNVIEWLSYKIHPLMNKPVLIIGASYHTQGSSRAQLSLRQILEAPGVGALVMPSDEFLLANVRTAFDEFGNLKDKRTIKFLDAVMGKFTKWVKVLNAMKDNEKKAAWEQEDLTASHPTDTTIDVPMDADDWVEQGATKTNAASGSDYVKLDRGLLTVDQLNWFLNTMPLELTYMDDNDQFIYYNNFLDHDEMLAPRYPKQVGSPMAACHPARAVDHVKQVIWALRNKQTDLIKMPVPGNKINEKYIMHCYHAMRSESGDFKGINEWVLDVWPTVKDYLANTGQMLVNDPNAKVDASASASVKPNAKPAADANASASVKEEAAQPAAAEKPDSGSSASVKS